MFEIKTVSPDFLGDDLQGIMPSQYLERIDKLGDRYYTRYIKEQDKYSFYLSATSFTKKSLGASQYLSQWRGKLGNEKADEVMHEKQAYGTLMHILIGELIKNKRLDVSTLDTRIDTHLEESSVNKNLKWQWLENMHNDLAAFMQFAQDKELKVIALEFPIYSDVWGLAGSIDLVCELNFAGKRKRAIVDFKSGRKGFYDSHELQLQVYKALWNEHYTDVFEVNMIFNWSPNAWREKPSYKLQNQTNSNINALQRMQVCKLEGWVKEPRNLKRLKGVLSFDQDVLENIEVIDFSKILKQRRIERIKNAKKQLTQ